MKSEICNCVCSYTSRMNRDGYIELADPNCEECGGTGNVAATPNKCDIVVCQRRVAWTTPYGTRLCWEHSQEYRETAQPTPCRHGRMACPQCIHEAQEEGRG